MQKPEKGPPRPKLVIPSTAILESISSPDTVRLSQDEEEKDVQLMTTLAITPSPISATEVESIQLSTPLLYRVCDSVERGCNCFVSKIIAPPLTILVVGLGICRAKCDLSHRALYGYCNSWMRLKLGPLMNIDVSMNFVNHPNSQPKAYFEGDWLPLMQFWQKSLSKLVENDLEFKIHSSRKPPSWTKRYIEYRLEKDITALYRSYPPTNDIFYGHCMAYNLLVYYCDLLDMEKKNITELTENDKIWLQFIRNRELFDKKLFLSSSNEIDTEITVD